MTDAYSPDHAHFRVFLVVVDDTDEWRMALRFACRRAEHTGGRVALLHVIEPSDFQHWAAVEEKMRSERRLEAERLLQRIAKDVNQLTGSLPALHLREGQTREELLKLLEDDPAISILVLGGRASGDSPGPLIQYLIGKGAPRLNIPITIVPGQLSVDQIDELA